METISTELLRNAKDAPYFEHAALSYDATGGMSQSGILDGYGDFLTLKDVSEAFGVCYKTASHWAQSGRIPSVKMGKRVYIPRARLLESIESGMRGNRNHGQI